MSHPYSHIALALEILKLLAAKPCTREELTRFVAEFVSQRDKNLDAPAQKLSRTIRELRDCGFDIKSAPHRPYELMASNFPLILSVSQRQALYVASSFLAQMGFSVYSEQIARLAQLSESDSPPDFKPDFSPPTDYSEEKLQGKIQQIQERCRQQRRYTIHYIDSQKQQKMWDLDRSELRLHDGTLYLFAVVPFFKTNYRHLVDNNVLFRVDRIQIVGPASATSWLHSFFPTITIRYRMTGPLAKYQPRRPHERIIIRTTDPNTQKDYQEIETQEDCVFWFRQRILHYGANAQVLDPPWLVDEIKQELEKAWKNYGDN